VFAPLYFFTYAPTIRVAKCYELAAPQFYVWLFGLRESGEF
jgi:hypothetical protein